MKTRIISKLMSPFLLVTMIIISNLPFCDAGNDIISFHGMSEQNEITDYLLIGEKSIALWIVFPENCTKYGVFLNSSIFDEQFDAFTIANRSKGQTLYSALEINPKVKPGTYYIDILLLYTNEQNQTMSYNVSLPLRVIIPLNITNVIIPVGLERLFEIHIRTYLNLTRLDVVLDSGGDIELNETHYSNRNITSGFYSYSALLKHREERGQQKLSYQIIGILNNRTFELLQSNIPVQIQWTKHDSQDTAQQTNHTLWKSLALRIIIVFILVTISWATYYYFRRNKLAKESGEVQSVQTLDPPLI